MGTKNGGKVYSESLSDLCAQLVNQKGKNSSINAAIIIFAGLLNDYVAKDREQLLGDILAMGATLIICGDSEIDCTLTNEFCLKVCDMKFQETSVIDLSYRNIEGMFHPKETLIESRLH